MSDPAKYRTKEELQEYQGRDPLITVKTEILEKKYADQKWFEEVEADVKKQVEDSVKFAEESPEPDVSEIYKDVYAQKDYPFITN